MPEKAKINFEEFTKSSNHSLIRVSQTNKFLTESNSGVELINKEEE